MIFKIKKKDISQYGLYLKIAPVKVFKIMQSPSQKYTLCSS